MSVEIAAEKKIDNRYTFKIPKLNLANQHVECKVPQLKNIEACRISYDENPFEEVSYGLIAAAYTSIQGFFIPIDWSFAKSCKIEIIAISTARVYYFPISDLTLPKFVEVAKYNLLNENVLKLSGNATKAIVVVSSGKFSLLSDIRLEKEQTAIIGEFSFDFPLYGGERTFFLKAKAASELDYCKVYLLLGEDLKTSLVTKRNVFLSYEAKIGMNPTEPLPAWHGQDVIYSANDQHMKILALAPIITEIQIGEKLTSEQKAQVACLLGISVKALKQKIACNERIFAMK